MTTPPNQFPGNAPFGDQGPRPMRADTNQPGHQAPPPAGVPNQPGRPSGPTNFFPQGQASANPTPGWQPAAPGQGPATHFGAPKKPGRARKIILIVCAAVVLLLAAVAGWGWWASKQSQQSSKAALNQLLVALRDGDANAALAAMDTSALDLTDEPLLTNDGIAANKDNLQFNPEFVLSDESSTSHTYQASIAINGQNKVVQWDVHRTDNEWLVDGSDVLSPVALDTSKPYVLNGIAVPEATSDIWLLPGSYQLSSGLPLLNYPEASSSFDLFTATPSSLSAELAPAEGVQAAVVEQARAILNGCAADRSAPTACNWPLDFTNGTPNPGTITWRLEPADPAADIRVPTQWSADTGYVSLVSVRYTTYASGQGTITGEGGGVGTFENVVDRHTTMFNIDLSGEAPVVSLA